jgi:hypothetical protein
MTKIYERESDQINKIDLRNDTMLQSLQINNSLEKNESISINICVNEDSYSIKKLKTNSENIQKINLDQFEEYFIN